MAVETIKDQHLCMHFVAQVSAVPQCFNLTISKKNSFHGNHLRKYGNLELCVCHAKEATRQKYCVTSNQVGHLYLSSDF